MPGGGFGTPAIDDGGSLPAGRLPSRRGLPVAGALAAFTTAATAAPTAASATLSPFAAITAITAITTCAVAALDSCLALGARRFAVAGRRLGAG
jgi:hypothetical protein